MSPRSVPTATPMSNELFRIMSSPSIFELIAGTAWSESTTALMKKLMKPSLTPYLLRKTSWRSLRSCITALMSHSLNVVRMAAVCWAMTSWAAILRRSGDSFFLTAREFADGGVEGVIDEKVAAGTAGADGEGAGLGTAGSGAGAGSAGFGAADFFGEVFGAAGVSAGTISATTWPIFTSSPSAAFRWTTPASGAATSCETLSVSSVNRTSSLRICSPSFLCQTERMPEEIDSPTAGTLTSIFMRIGRFSYTSKACLTSAACCALCVPSEPAAVLALPGRPA